MSMTYPRDALVASMRRIIKKISAAVSGRSRARKLSWLQEQINPGSTVLLVGASVPRDDDLGVDNIVERGLVQHAHAHALVYDDGDPRLGCPHSQGDARKLPFPDDSFDYVVSNAVIEHVGGPDGARGMLAESRRVARVGAFHTTPNRWFPIETHTQLPLLHWLPRRPQSWAFEQMGHPLWKSYTWLYSRNTLAALDPHFRVTHSGRITLIAVWIAQE